MKTREELLSIRSELPREEIDVPEWGPTFVRGMNAGGRDRFEILMTRNDKRDYRATIAAFSVCDAAGNLVFSEADIPRLTNLPYYILEAVVEASVRLSKFTAEDVEAFRKNSGSSQADAS